MSVQPLRPAPRVPEEVAHARSSVRSAAAVPVGTLGVDDLAEAIQATAALEAQVAALHLRLVAEADRRKVAESLGATGADAWVAALTGSTRAVVAGGLWLARRLEETYDATRQAFAAGAISQAQARVVVEASDRLPEAVSQEQRAFAEAGLVAKAGPRSRRGCRSTTTATARSRAGSSFRSCTGTCCGRPSSGSRHRNDCPATGPESSPRTTP
jgi:ParB-like chromosome segregation protein Spo0J